MLSQFYRFIGLVVVLFIGVESYSQCSNFNSNYPTGVFTATTTGWYRATTCAYGGDFQEYFVVEGGEYYWTSCYDTSFDSEITLWDEGHTTVIAHEDSNCGTIHGTITWTATFTGIVHLLLSEQGCLTNSSCQAIYYRMLTPPPPPANDEPCNPINLSIDSSCDYETVTNAGATDSGISDPSCGVYDGGDVWFSFNAPASGNVTISTRAGMVTDAVMAAYRGACGSLTEIDCDDDTNDFMPALELTGLTPGETIFIRLFAYDNNEQGDFELCAYEPCSTAPSNNENCSAQSLVIGSPTFGDTGCSDDTNDPSVPSCWTGGSENTVWYSFLAPAGGEVRIDTEPLSIGATQIALFSGVCNSLSLLDCNRNAGEGCGISGSSSLAYSGLTPGNTYFISVDGQNNAEGQFNITVSNTAGLAPQTGSDCSAPISICSDNFSVADPGPQGTGNFCDFDDRNNCTGGERNSIWYQIDVGATGDFLFTLVPNDGGPTTCGTETDYDFVLWKIAGSGTTTDCSGISSDASTGLLACNYDTRGVTGISSNGNRPPGYNNCFNQSFENAVAVTAGDVLLLAIQNYTGSTNGFNIDFSDSDPGVVPISISTSLIWSGGVDDSWEESGNWGNCGAVPSCLVDATIPASVGLSPVLTGEHYVRDLVIETGTTLVLEAGAELHVCGDLSNQGAIEMDVNSTLYFDSPIGNQRVSGNLTGSNAIGNLVIEKTVNNVLLESDIEIKGDFLTVTSTSRFNTQGNTVYLQGNFRNNNGGTTYRGIGATGRLVFNGSTEQSYSQGSTNLNLSTVVIENSGPGISLLTDMRMNGSYGSLELRNGIVKTNDKKIFLRNTDPAALNEGNTNSYIEGKIRRYVNSTGLYHFPVGSATTGYQRADVNFRSHSFDYLTVLQSPWSTNPGPLMMSECMATYDLDALDNGFFTMSANRNPTSADYDITLFNHSFGNSGGAQGWTVMKDSGSGWMLDGDCQVSSADTVYRTGLTGFSDFATAQASNPLPIELLTFKGEAVSDGNLLDWVTASEVNNDYFTLERSPNGRDFEEISEVEGAGFSSEQIAYQYLDRSAPNGLSYYRLKQTDFDGTFTYSDIIAVERGESISDESIWPNPVDSYVQVRFEGVGTGISSIHIADILGKEIVSVDNWSQLNEGLIIIRDTENLNSGVYFISAYDRTGEQILNKRFVKR